MNELLHANMVYDHFSKTLFYIWNCSSIIPIKDTDFAEGPKQNRRSRRSLSKQTTRNNKNNLSQENAEPTNLPGAKMIQKIWSLSPWKINIFQCLTHGDYF